MGLWAFRSHDGAPGRHCLEDGNCRVRSADARVQENVTDAKQLGNRARIGLAPQLANGLEPIPPHDRLHLAPSRAVTCDYEADSAANLDRKRVERLGNAHERNV